MSTELDSLRGGARVAPSIVVAIKKPRARRRKAPAEPAERVEAKSEQEARGEAETPAED